MDFPERATISSLKIGIRPRYNETDQGGVAHHSVYPVWFEMGRTELLRVNGLAYKDLEEAGVFFVVARLEIKYRHLPDTTRNWSWKRAVRKSGRAKSSIVTS